MPYNTMARKGAIYPTPFQSPKCRTSKLRGISSLCHGKQQACQQTQILGYLEQASIFATQLMLNDIVTEPLPHGLVLK